MRELIITDHNGTEIPFDEGAICLEEFNRYEVELTIEITNAKLWLGDQPLNKADSGNFYFRTDFAAGATSIRIDIDGKSEILPVTIRCAQEKIPESLWLFILKDLETWIPGLTTGTEAVRNGAVGLSGVHISHIAEALLPLVPFFEKAMFAVLENPRQAIQGTWEDVPLHSARRVDNENIVFLSRHPEISGWLDPWKSLEFLEDEPTMPQRFTQETFDHPVNRYMAWLIKRVYAKLKEIALSLQSIKNDPNSLENTAWCLPRSKRFETAAEKIYKRFSLSFLSELSPEPASEAALLVVMDDPLYARVHNIGRTFLSPLFNFDDKSITPAAVRPTFSIYELWCFLSIARSIKATLSGWTWKQKFLKNLVTTNTGSGAEFIAEAPDGSKLKIEFNPVFSSYLNRSGKQRWSISGERRPDIVVSWKPHNKEGRWIFLDAKYRAGERNLMDAMSSVHIYRDSLRYNEYSDVCVAGALLAPSQADHHLPWFSDDFRKEYGCCIWPLRPNSEFIAKCTSWIFEQLKL